MGMRNQILTTDMFTKGVHDTWKVRLEVFGATRAFAGCSDNINIWTTIEIDAVMVYASARPTTDVFVIIETGAM